MDTYYTHFSNRESAVLGEWLLCLDGAVYILVEETNKQTHM